MRMQPQPAEARLAIDSFMPSSLQSIPKAEKNLLKELAISTICGTFANCCIPIFSPTTVIVLAATFSIGRYLFQHKPKQDAAVKKYYEEVGPSGLREGGSMQYYYQNSQTVKDLGGVEAIDNACATQIF